MATERPIPQVGEEIHLPGPSAQPLLVAVFTTIALIGITITTPVPFIIGMVGLILTLAAWTRDAVAEFRALPDHHHHGDEHGHGHDEPAPAASTKTVEQTDSSATETH